MSDVLEATAMYTYRVFFKAGFLNHCFGIGLFQGDFSELDTAEYKHLGLVGTGQAINRTDGLIGSKTAEDQIYFEHLNTYFVLLMDMATGKLSILNEIGQGLGSWNVKGIDAQSVRFGAHLVGQNSFKIVSRKETACLSTCGCRPRHS